MQEFKYVDAFGENYPQLILQQTILLKGANWTALTFLSIITSCYSAFTTMAGLTVSLPFYINGIKRIQFKDFVLEYCIILPLIFFSWPLMSGRWLVNVWIVVACKLVIGGWEPIVDCLAGV